MAKTTAVFYFNDEPHSIRVRIFGTDGDHFTTLGPAEGRFFEVESPDESILWVKKWPTMLMISYIDPQGLPQSPHDQDS